MARELAILVTARNMASSVLKDVRRDVKGVQSEAGRAVRNTARNLAFVGGAAAAGLTAVVVQSVKDASALQQAAGAVESVFGKSMGRIEDFADQAAEAAGLSRRQVMEMGAVVGAQLQAMGFNEDEAAKKTIELEKRAADLAATFGGPTQDAVQAISALLRGERDPIERYGVSLKQADINAEMAARGLGNLEGQEKKLAEAQVALDLLMQQTNKTSGQFARESDSAAGAQARLQANLENTRATIGTALLPQVAKLTDRLNDAVIDHLPEIEAFAAELPGIFDDLLEIVESLPWGAIGEAMKLMGQGARAALDIFTSMPPWVQTAVLTGWGLNKLTGGALGNIVGALGSGLIKGVLGMNAGVVNAKAGVVNVAGPVSGGPGGVGGKGPGIPPLLGAGLAVAGGVAVGAAIGGPIHEATVAPARDFMESETQRVASTGDPARIGAGLRAIESQIREFRSKPPQWQQIMEPTIQQIEAQRDVLKGELQKIWQTEERGAAAARDAVPWAQRNVQAIQSMNASEGTRWGGTIASLRAIQAKKTTFNPHVNVTANLHNTVVVSGVQTIYRLNSLRQSLNQGTTVDGFI